MRVRTKLVSLAVAFSVLLTASVVFASGFVNVSMLRLFSASPMDIGPLSTPNVFVDPGTIIKDYVNNPGYQVGNTLLIHINISDVTDLYSYQVNVTWNTAMLNFTGIQAYGDFLYRTTSPDKTSRIENIYAASNVTGYASVAETILRDYPGITGKGRLVTLKFLIKGYGFSDIRIGSGGSLPTMLLDSAGNTIAYTSTNGYFRNALTGDANIDKAINVFDILAVKSRWGRIPTSPDWVREYDVNDDQAVNVFDILTVKANWGRSTP